MIIFLTDRRHIDAVERLFQSEAYLGTASPMRSLLGVLNIFGSLLAWFALYFVLPIITALLYGELAPLNCVRLHRGRRPSRCSEACCCGWRRDATATT